MQFHLISPHAKKAVISLAEATQGLRISLVKIGCLSKEKQSLCSQLDDGMAEVLNTLSLQLPILDLWRDGRMGGGLWGKEVQDSLPASVTWVSVQEQRLDATCACKSRSGIYTTDDGI